MTMTINRLDRVPGLADALIRATTFDSSDLVPVIAQDARTGGVRMFAWANREALRRTIETGLAHFWSRSRQALWRKGEVSGNVLRVRDIRLDCDGDVVLYVTDAEGPSCHTGRTSCFYRGLGVVPAGESGGEEVAALAEDDGPADPPAVVIARVAQVIARRRSERPEKSYVVSLLDAGWPKVLGKIMEESGELVDALPEGDPAHTAHEAADLMFHMLVGLELAGVSVDDVFAQLRRRFGISGIDEKASRGTVAQPHASGESTAKVKAKPKAKAKPIARKAAAPRKAPPRRPAKSARRAPAPSKAKTGKSKKAGRRT